eukprot:c21099_g2_i1 orf=75-1337(+)
MYCALMVEDTGEHSERGFATAAVSHLHISAISVLNAILSRPLLRLAFPALPSSNWPLPALDFAAPGTKRAGRNARSWESGILSVSTLVPLKFLQVRRSQVLRLRELNALRTTTTPAMAAAAHAGAAALGVATTLCSDDRPCPTQQQLLQYRGASSARTVVRVPCPLGFSSFASRIEGALARSSAYVQQGSCSASRFSPVCEVAVDGSSNASAVAGPNVELNTFAKKGTDPSQKPHAAVQETTISALMADVANLVKLVDSRDIVELELKNSDYEILIRKKEALPPPPAIPQLYPQAIAQTSVPTYTPPPAMPATHLPSTPTSSSPPPPPASALTALSKSPAMEHPPMLSPMAGTFYRSPAPGEPAFVKVGDRVQKGQVICIVEAMKLMNEIEADHSGTIIDIVAEDGKPVSVDTPLFVIKP